MCLLTLQGFPSIGDEQSTVPVPKAKWFEYAGERSGRFQVGHPAGFPVRQFVYTAFACQLVCYLLCSLQNALDCHLLCLLQDALDLQGYNNKDGTAKTECGIHVAGDDEESGMSNIRK